MVNNTHTHTQENNNDYDIWRKYRISKKGDVMMKFRIKMRNEKTLIKYEETKNYSCMSYAYDILHSIYKHENKEEPLNYRT